MCPDLCSLIQRAGRAARAPGTGAVFIYMVENWATEKYINRRSHAYINDPDTPVQVRTAGQPKSKPSVGIASVAVANSTICLRVEFMDYLGVIQRDGVVIGTARISTLRCSVLATFGKPKGVVSGSGSPWSSDQRERTMRGREAIVRESSRYSQPGDKRYMKLTNPSAPSVASKILSDDGIALIAKVPSWRLRRDGLSVITIELKESSDWESRYARGIFDVIQKYDVPE